jgi:hypothetical protein
MLRTKFFMGMLLTLIVMAMQASPALAAAAQEDPPPTATPAATPDAPITGTIQTITLQTDSEGVTTVVVTLTDGTSVNLSLEAAFNLGLVSTSDPATAAANDAMIGQTVEIAPTDVITPPAEEEAQHPVGSALALFFGLDYQTVDEYHDDGTGFGVIAQACWLSYSLAGDASECGAIIEAKQSGDYSAFTLPDGTTASNWGQFKKAIEDNHDPLKTLGAIMSGHAQNDENTPDDGDDASGEEGDEDASETDASTLNDENGNGNGNGNGGGNGNGNGQGNNGGDDNGKGKGKGKGNGNGHGKNK